VFSLGSTLYAAVEGEPPFGIDDNTLALLRSVAEGQVRPPQQAGPLSALLMHMLREDPAARPSMSEAVLALGAVARGDSPAGRTPPPPGRSATATAVGLPVIPPAEPPRSTKSGSTKSGSTKSGSTKSGQSGSRRSGFKQSGSRRSGFNQSGSRSADPGFAAAGYPESRQSGSGQSGSGQSGSGQSGSGQSGSPQLSGPPPQPPHDGTGQDRPRWRRRALVGGAGACLLGLLGALAFALGNGDETGGQAAPTTAPAATPAPATTSAAPTRSSAPAPPPAKPPPATPGPAEFEQTVRAYYRLLPGNTAAAWQFLGEPERAKAGGFAGYADFWNGIDQVQIRGPVTVQGDTVLANLQFGPKGGGQTFERYQFTMATAPDGRILINSASRIGTFQPSSNITRRLDDNSDDDRGKGKGKDDNGAGRGGQDGKGRGGDT
jgi:hypothetical protein